jgi:NADPH:quinone reductase-like Zn-dependent oxidoreductase
MGEAEEARSQRWRRASRILVAPCYNGRHAGWGQGSVSIVTGASSGIGLAVARALVKAGGSVALVARTASKLEAGGGGAR